jgi:hypothetical protein
VALTFDEPEETGNGVRMYPKDILGHLLLVWAVDYIEYSPTQFTKPGQPADVIIVDCVDLSVLDPDTNQPGWVARRTWWRQAQLIRGLRGKIGNKSPQLVVMTRGATHLSPW